MEKKKISILGSTGSIGTQALEVVAAIRDGFEILSLAGGDNITLLMKQVEEFKPKNVCVRSQSSGIEIKKRFPDINVLIGDEGLEEICSDKQNDLIVVAVSGKIGLKPTLRAIENKIDIALANKETLVMAGDIVMQKAGVNDVKILPVDSEHSAIFQCLNGDVNNLKEVKKLIITASGGPFKDKSLEEIKASTVEQTLAHPKWNMGKKITVDSATLMNKGLEVIEAHHLFGIDYDNIDVVIHPQSILHSAVEFVDGSVVAQIGLPSMHLPIQYALTYPERIEGIKSESFSFLDAQRLDFEKPDLEKFPCLKLAYEAGKTGGSLPICLNAANEEAVMAFLKGQIKLYNIFEITYDMMSQHKVIQSPSIEDIMGIDTEIRIKTNELLTTVIR